MRILIDECLPRKLKHQLANHDVSTVQEMGWSGVKNGALLRLMMDQFEVFITIDGNLAYQQNMSAVNIIVIVLNAPNRACYGLSKMKITGFLRGSEQITHLPKTRRSMKIGKNLISKALSRSRMD